MRYAIIENNKVANVIIVQPETASKDFPYAIQETQETGKAWIGARFNGKKFEPQQPYSSWVWNEDTFDYDSPKPKPEGDYYWDETEQDWFAITEEEEPTKPEAEA